MDNRDQILCLNPELFGIAVANEHPERPVTDKPLRFRFERMDSPSLSWQVYLAVSTGQWRGQYSRVVCAANMKEALSKLLAEFPNAKAA